MKHLLYILLLSLIIYSNIYSADPEPYCSAPAGGSINLSQEGGIYLTAQGELKVLVVFVRFKDDTAPHPYWPVGQSPQNYTTFIDSNLQIGSTHHINLTNYFKQMSLGLFKVTGQVLSVETPNIRSHYGGDFYLANKEVLQQKVDPLINFEDYDKWGYNEDYQHSNQPDGTVDMIVMIWRGLVFSDQWSGKATLGASLHYKVENETKTIKTSFGGGEGSGVTVQYWGERTPERNFKVTIHEIGHWLLGGNHPYSEGTNNEHKIWGILSRADEGICTNTYERERLAWINPTPITGDVLNAPFQDYVEYGDAYKYHPSNGASNEYFYFENHQKLSTYDNVTNNANDEGIFIIHQFGIYDNSDNIRIKTSNG